MTFDRHLAGIEERIEHLWPAARLARLQRLGRLAADAGAALYLVGGVPRDLFLNRPSNDWDLTLVGDFEGFLQRLLEQGFRVEKRSAFATATLRDPENLPWELALCRAERYPRPGALPEISPAPAIDIDLRRRDFRCNAMALSLRPEDFLRLVDPFHGRDDIHAGILEILHPESFRDDPTRLLRGLRFSLRFGFRLGPLAQAQRQGLLAADGFATLSGTRLFRELWLLLQLPDLAASVSALRAWGLAALLPGAHLPTEFVVAKLRRLAAVMQQFRQNLPEEPPEQPAVALLLLSALGTAAERATHWQRWQWRGVADWQRALDALPAKLPPQSDAASHARYWQDWSVAGILCALALQDDPELQRSAWQYLQVQRRQKTPVDGRDLQAWGVAPGPGLGALLARVQDATWNGVITNKDEAWRWLKEQNLLP
ncbi:CCA tRNA nucleotidyltransferase [Candidatus Igneacidithiobacillus taiwanensis]|uniref:CCA tRNA nucleotidyltransferase n=1 Tax=Candidatus Igneacidithiobacillus taiwanensis TaxID=1945924 RepID=UPI00289B8C07|nr:CCA tRNA nucleotidyltransferase [Candidatus Igneacidithiobacillus taiwanensis]